jgi:SAM-dependent methyltransferase
MSSWSSGYVTDISYLHSFFRELTPGLLALVCLVRGRKSPDPTKPLNFCELACGQGVTTNLLAAANPHIQFYATDFNPSHIVGAKALAAKAATPNVQFYDQSFTEFVNEPTLPDFDIICLHGAYSWVSVDNRRVIVDFIRRKLRPGGLVYVSYNAQPGWAPSAPLRHLMYLHGQARGGPTAARIEPALQLITRLQETNARYFQHNPILKQRLEAIKGKDSSYLAHEYYNDTWTLFYHADVAAEMAEAKLTYVGSGALLEHIDRINLTPEQRAVLADLTDPMLRETVRDFLVDQNFRRDVFVKGSVPLTAHEAQELWLDRRFALSSPRDQVPLQVSTSLGQVSLHPEAYDPVLDSLARAPSTVRGLMAEHLIARKGWTSLLQTLVVLVGAGHVQPCLDSDCDSDRVARTTAFNAAVIDQAQSSSDVQFLASPVTGGSVSLGRTSLLFLLGRQQNQADLPQFAWDVLNRYNQRLIKDGKPLVTPEENLAELRTRYELFRTKQLPILLQLGAA